MNRGPMNSPRRWRSCMPRSSPLRTLSSSPTRRITSGNLTRKYVNFWGIPPHMMISAHAGELWNYTSPQLKDPARYLARIHEIIASSPPETFDVLQLKDGRVFERNSAIQLIKQRNRWPCVELPRHHPTQACAGRAGERKESVAGNRVRRAACGGAGCPGARC